MEARDLAYFLAVVDAGHISKAAIELGLTQPALTKSLGRLERSLNARVLERTSKGVHVTAFGERVYREAMRVRVTLDDARRSLVHLREGAAGHVRIGTGHAIAHHLLPTVCGRLMRSHPELTLEITLGTGRGLLPALLRGELDMILSGIPPEQVPGIRHEVIMEDEVVVIAQRAHALQRRRSVSIGALAAQPWALTRSRSLLAEWLDQRWREAGVTPPIPRVQTDSITTLLGIVAASEALTFASWSTIERSPYHAALRPLPRGGLTWRRKLGATYRDGGYLPAAAKGLIDLLREAAAGGGQ
jgi:DNA-binding transcriptional LysR family regulator